MHHTVIVIRNIKSGNGRLVVFFKVVVSTRSNIFPVNFDEVVSIRCTLLYTNDNHETRVKQSYSKDLPINSTKDKNLMIKADGVHQFMNDNTMSTTFR